MNDPVKALSDLVDSVRPTPGGIYYLGKGDGTDQIIPDENIDGPMASLYRSQRKCWINDGQGGRSLAILRPGCGIDYINFTGLGKVKIAVDTELWNGNRYIKGIASDGLQTLNGESLSEKRLNVLSMPNAEQIITLRATTTNPPSDSIQVIGPYFYRNQNTGDLDMWLTGSKSVVDTVAALTSGQHQLGILCLDTSVTSDANKLVLVTATAVTATGTLPSRTEFGPEHIKAIDIGDYTPIIAVYMYYGQLTDEGRIEESDFYRQYPVRPAFSSPDRLLKLPASTTLTITSGAISATQSFAIVSSESGTTDNLDTITAGTDRMAIVLQANTGHTITVRHGVGNIYLNGFANFALVGSKTLLLVHDGTNWSDTGAGGGSASGGHVIQNNGVDMPAEPKLNIIAGSNVDITLADNSGAGSTDLTIAVVSAATGKKIVTKTVIHDETLASDGSFDVQNIPQIYDHLEIEIYGRGTVSAKNDVVCMFLNNDTTPSNYITQQWYGAITTSAAAQFSYPQVAFVPGATMTSGYSIFSHVEIPRYTTANAIKKMMGASDGKYDTGSTNYVIERYTAFWANTAAINRIMVRTDNDPTDLFLAGSRLIVYGIKEETVGTPIPPDYILIQDQKAQTTNGGTFTSGAWRTRDLNTEVVDTGNWASVASNQITLKAGTYRCHILAPAFSVNRHQTILYDTTAAATILTGTAAYAYQHDATYGIQNLSVIAGRFTLSVDSVLEVRHICETTKSNNGLGVYGNFTTEVYTSAEFWREPEQSMMQYDVSNISNPPTDAELDTIFGSPSTFGTGKLAVVNDNGGGSNEYLIWSDNTSWWYIAGTKAT